MKHFVGLLCLICPYILCGQYLFNSDTSAQLYHGYTNSFKCEKGTPLCFDGTTKITPSDKENIYYIEVLDSVTRGEGTLNITKYLTHPDGFQEKVFIDKFTFSILPLPETVIFIGNSHSFEKIDVNNLDLKVGFREPQPQPHFKIKEFTLIANKKVLTIKSSKITPQAEAFIKTLSEGDTLKIEVVYIDPLKKTRRVNKEFFL